MALSCMPVGLRSSALFWLVEKKPDLLLDGDWEGWLGLLPGLSLRPGLELDHEDGPEPAGWRGGRELRCCESLGLARPISGRNVGGMMAVPARAATPAIWRAKLLPPPPPVLLDETGGPV